MSAKPQPMAGQSDAADDLIAELAKLMAQDAKGDRPAEAAAAVPAFSVRIPGVDNPPATAPMSPVDLQRKAATEPRVSQAPATVVAPVDAAPEPFDFDFDFGAPKQAPITATQSAASPVEPALSAVTTADHDSIADLIAAELSATPPPQPRVAPEPAALVAGPAARSAPQPGANWTPTAVAANLGGQDKSPRPALRALNLQPAQKPEPKVEQDRFNIPPVFGVGTRPVAAEPVVSPVVVAPASQPPVQQAAVPQAPLKGLVEPSFAARQQPVPAPAASPFPAAQGDAIGRDPIDEIEDLIGRAMRVEFDEPSEDSPEQRPAPSPALRSLATPTVAPAAPVASQKAAPRTLSGADEAILAAAAATGAEIGWVETSEINEIATAPVRNRRPSRGRGITRAVAGPLVAITLLLAAGFGLYWVLGLGGDTGPAPLLTADTTPTKVTPAVEPDTAATQQSVVFNEIDGVVPGAEEQLVSRDQANVNEVTQVSPTAPVSEEGLANRKVRTVTVRPDGTIVSGDESVAGNAILPIARPNVPEVPGADTTTPSLLANAATDVATPPAAPTADTAVTPEPATAEAAAPLEPAVTPVVPGSTVPAVDLAGNPIAGRTAPVPLLRPADLAQSTAPTVTATSPVNAIADPATAGGGNFLPPPPAGSTLGATTPAAQPVAAAPEPAASAAPATTIPGAVEVEALPNNAPAYAQLASLRTEDEARQAAQNLVTRFGPLFGGANMEVQRVDLGTRGIYYRVRVPANSAAAASGICTNVVAAGGDCVPM